MEVERLQRATGERKIRGKSRGEGEKTANWQVRRRTTLLDWRVTHIRLEVWNEKEKRKLGAHG